MTHVNNKLCQSQWVCSALVSVPRSVTRWNSSTVIRYQLWSCPESDWAVERRLWRRLWRWRRGTEGGRHVVIIGNLSSLPGHSSPGRLSIIQMFAAKLDWNWPNLYEFHQNLVWCTLHHLNLQPTFKVHRCNHKSQLSDDYDQVIVCLWGGDWLVGHGECWIIHVGNIDYYLLGWVIITLTPHQDFLMMARTSSVSCYVPAIWTLQHYIFLFSIFCLCSQLNVPLLEVNPAAS